MKTRIVVLGAGFGGLELSTCLAETLGDAVEVTLIDRADAFIFGYSKLDVMFGHAAAEAVWLPYAKFVKPGVRVRRETVTAIDPTTRRVTTNAGQYEADHLVLALGADYDAAATPGLTMGVNEFYSPEGAAALAEPIRNFRKGHVVIGVCGAPYKCPPAPSECSLMLHDALVARGVRDDCHITFVTALSSPVPPSPETSAALLAEFASRKIEFIANQPVRSIDVAAHRVTLGDGRQLPCDLFLGVPRHVAPAVVVATGLTEAGFVKVNQRTMETEVPGIYAIGDIANSGTPKAGVFAEGAARVVAANIVSRIRQQEPTARNSGQGICYIEFGGGRVGRVEVDFFSGPTPTGKYGAPSEALRADKTRFGNSRRARWFGLT